MERHAPKRSLFVVVHLCCGRIASRDSLCFYCHMNVVFALGALKETIPMSVQYLLTSKGLHPFDADPIPWSKANYPERFLHSMGPEERIHENAAVEKQTLKNIESR